MARLYGGTIKGITFKKFMTIQIKLGQRVDYERTNKSFFVPNVVPFKNQKKPYIICFQMFKAFWWWCLQESNQGHKDFQSFALPTELRHQLLN